MENRKGISDACTLGDHIRSRRRISGQPWSLDAPHGLARSISSSVSVFAYAYYKDFKGLLVSTDCATRNCCRGGLLFANPGMTGEEHLDKRPVTEDRAKLSESEALVGVEDLRQESFWES
jgi:hypothetical protein